MNIFISANNTNQGKTYSTLLLMEEFAKQGYRVGAFKPIETGVENYPLDGLKLLNKSKELNNAFEDILLKDIVPIQLKLPAAPIVAGDVNFDKIKEAYQKATQALKDAGHEIVEEMKHELYGKEIILVSQSSECYFFM